MKKRFILETSASEIVFFFSLSSKESFFHHSKPDSTHWQHHCSVTCKVLKGAQEFDSGCIQVPTNSHEGLGQLALPAAHPQNRWEISGG